MYKRIKHKIEAQFHITIHFYKKHALQYYKTHSSTSGPQEVRFGSQTPSFVLFGIRYSNMTTWSVPILALRAAGSCAVMKCASTESDRSTSQAACSLQNIRINWYRRAIRRKTSAGSTDPIQKNPETGSKSKSELDNNDLSPLFFFRSQMSQFIARSSSSEDSMDPDTETYIKLDAVMSVCDTEFGPAIELRTVSQAYTEMLVKYELTDVSKNMDMITNLPVNDHTSPESFPILERIIPLSMVENAALGGKWDWANILSGNGDLHCGVKVFGCECFEP